jgi:TonB family protein
MIRPLVHGAFMSVTCTAALALAFSSTTGISQQQSQPPSSPQASPNSSVYDLDRDIAPPVLIPEPLPVASQQQCAQQMQGKVVLNMEVDAQGTPASFYFADPLGDELDRLALSVAQQDRFSPATRNGAAVAVRQSVEMNLEGCIATAVDISGKQVRTIRLKEQPSQRVGNLRKPHPTGFIHGNIAADAHGNSPPIPLVAPEAGFSEEARQKHITGMCLVSLSVDAHGLPQNPRVVRPLGYGLDDAAIEAIQNYRFVPAMRQGKPVSVMMSIAVNFRQ